MISLPLRELKLIPKSRDIKDYKNKSENSLIKILSEYKPKINLFLVKPFEKENKRGQKRFYQIKIQVV